MNNETTFHSAEIARLTADLTRLREQHERQQREYQALRRLQQEAIDASAHFQARAESAEADWQTADSTLTALRETRGWQPIETHDGNTTTPAIVHAVDRFPQVGEAEYRGDGDGRNDGWAWEGYNYRIFPTHWQPLPDPPAEAVL